MKSNNPQEFLNLKAILRKLFPPALWFKIAGARFFKQFFVDLKTRNISLKIAEARSEVRDILRSENLEEILGHISRFVSIDDFGRGSDQAN